MGPSRRTSYPRIYHLLLVSILLLSGRCFAANYHLQRVPAHEVRAHYAPLGRTSCWRARRGREGGTYRIVAAPRGAGEPARLRRNSNPSSIIIIIIKSMNHHKQTNQDGSETRVVAPQQMKGVPGLYVGSGLAFKADCVNVDVEGIVDSSGSSTSPGELFALVAQEAILSETEPRVLYFLQHDSTKPFPFVSGRFDWIMSERECCVVEMWIYSPPERCSTKRRPVYLFNAQTLWSTCHSPRPWRSSVTPSEC